MGENIEIVELSSLMDKHQSLEYEVKKKVLVMVETLKLQYDKENEQALKQEEDKKKPILKERHEQDQKIVQKRQQKLDAKEEMRK